LHPVRHTCPGDHLYILEIVMDPEYFPEEYHLEPQTKKKTLH